MLFKVVNGHVRIIAHSLVPIFR